MQVLRRTNRLTFTLITTLFSVVLAQGQSDSLILEFANGEPVSFGVIRWHAGQYYSDHTGKVDHDLTPGIRFEVYHINGNDTFVYDTSQFRYVIHSEGMLLPEQKVKALPPRALFSREFAGFPIVESPTERIKRAYGLTNMSKELKAVSRASHCGVVVSGPISHFYDLYSKEAKSKREFVRLERIETNKVKLDEYFQSSVVGMLLPNCETCVSDLERFRNFCSIHPDVIDELSKIELLERISRCGMEIVAQDIILNELWSDVHYPTLLRY